MSIQITTKNLIPISATYPYSDNINIKSTLTTWKDGYTMYTHPVFESNIDCSLNNNSILYLTSATNLFNIIEETVKETVLLGDYVILKINSKYVTNVNNELYLTTASSNNSFFRLIINYDNTITFLHGIGLYVTVADQSPFDLTLESLLTVNDLHHQKFNFQVNNNNMYITTDIINESDIGPTHLERYWSYTKFGPEVGKLRANGTIENNDYLFEVTNFDISFKPTGLIQDHTWVQYNNDLTNSENNKNVEINESQSITGIKVNHLFDLPYNNAINITNSNMSVNFANMKTIQNSNYEYRKKEINGN